MTLHVELPLRERLNQERKRVRWHDIFNIVKENYVPPDTHTLGDPISDTHIRLDNDYKNKCHGDWSFALIPKTIPKAKVKTYAKATKKRSSKK
jgi:hypothetical protein